MSLASPTPGALALAIRDLPRPPLPHRSLAPPDVHLVEKVEDIEAQPRLQGGFGGSPPDKPLACPLLPQSAMAGCRQ